MCVANDGWLQCHFQIFSVAVGLFLGSTNETSIFITHCILVIVRYQRTSSEAAGCHYCSLCTFTWHFGITNVLLKNILCMSSLLLLKCNLQVVSHMGILWYRAVCYQLSPAKWFQMNFLSFVWSYMLSTLAEVKFL
jgi:hypothetical protein